MCTGVTDFFCWYTCGRAALSNLIKSVLQHSMFAIRPTIKTYISIVCHLMFETIYIFSKRAEYWKTSFSPPRNNSIIEQNHCFVYHLCSATGSGSNKSDWCVITGLIALPPSALSGGFLHTKHWELNVNGAKQHHLEVGNWLPSLAMLQDFRAIVSRASGVGSAENPQRAESVKDNTVTKDDSSGNYKNHSFPKQTNLVPGNNFSVKTWKQRIILIYFSFSFFISHFQ